MKMFQYIDYKYFDYNELDDYEGTEDGREREEDEQRLCEKFWNLCSIITELVQELNNLLEDLLKEQWIFIIVITLKKEWLE